MAGFLRIITQAVLTATPRKRPPLGLLVIAKLTLYKKILPILLCFAIEQSIVKQDKRKAISMDKLRTSSD